MPPTSEIRRTRRSGLPQDSANGSKHQKDAAAVRVRLFDHGEGTRTNRQGLIIGAGIAGAPQQRWRCAVLESTPSSSRPPRSREMKPGLSSISHRTASTCASARLEHVLDRIGFQNDRIIFQNDAGRVLADVPVGGITVMRGALSAALREPQKRAA